MERAPGEAPSSLRAKAAGVSGDGEAALAALTSQPHQSQASQLLVIIHYPLV